MKKKIIALILTGSMVLSVCSCGNREPEAPDITINTEIEETQESEISKEPQKEEMAEGSKEEQEETAQGKEEIFDFVNFKNLEFCFSSGAGGWATLMTINADGSFSGIYFDGEMGVTGEEYPNGTMYQCNFSGQFTQPVKVNEYTYSMQIRELNYAEEAGSEEIKDGVRYCYSTVYGLDEAEDILIYLPGAPLAELSEEFRSWVGYYDLSYTTDTELPFYALNNEAVQCGFSSYDIVDNLKGTIDFTEEWAASLENSIENDPLTQTEYNEKTQELYEVWDYALNEVWAVLQKTQDAEAMSALTIEEREWIASKEQAVADAGAEFAGGTMQSMIMNQKAAEMTKNRVYELMEAFEN